MFRRLKRLWELSGTLSDQEDIKMANRLKTDQRLFSTKARAKRDKKLATVMQSEPLEVFPTQEELEQKQNDTTS